MPRAEVRKRDPMYSYCMGWPLKMPAFVVKEWPSGKGEQFPCCSAYIHYVSISSDQRSFTENLVWRSCLKWMSQLVFFFYANEYQLM